ncbi:MAG: protein kinase domain-containing protein, partial [Gemmatimonadales bacterium]
MDRYRLDREIGRGGMATVYLAEDLKHGRPVAIKVLRPELAELVGEPARFLTEIRIAARLNHPHILSLHDSGECDGILYYVTPFMGCESLRGRLEREPQLPIDEALRITQGVAAALDYAHRHDVVHRDIKPENILLHEGHPIVADFGIARAIWALRSGRGPSVGVAHQDIVVGTADYMSPEQAGGDRAPDGRSDQYSLACVLYEMLAGRPPFGGGGSSDLSTLARQVTQTVPSICEFRPDVPAPVERALLKALAKDPADRFATTGEFAAALVTPLSGLGPMARGARPRGRGIAVVPFLNASREPENEYLSDGITDELITALAAVEGLEVVPRSSVFALKDRREDVRAIGDLLQVATVLEGAVQRSGPRLRITVRLTDAVDGRHLWSARYDGAVDDVFALQDEIARSVVGTLRRTVLDGLAEPVPRRYTSNVK